MFDNKKILITGGTGSFGNAFVSRLLKTACDEIRILSRDEAKQEFMRRELQDDRLRFHIGDVRDRRSVDRAVRGVEYVFHAAALKQVPSCEFFPDQALLTNVIGSQNVLESAVDHRVRHVVCLSTDKAVYPVNAMGMTKALMEKTVQAKARSLGENAHTILSCVRYGNVLYTRGSVVPVFVDQILAGQPLTVTNPAMTRFLLSLTDAIGLVEFALTNNRQGDLYIRRSPACTLTTLAEALKKIFASDVPVNVFGIRPGEKIHETLATFQEVARSEDIGSFMRVPMDSRDLNYHSYTDEGRKGQGEVEDYTSANTEQLDIEGTIGVLLQVTEIQEKIKHLGRTSEASPAP